MNNTIYPCLWFDGNAKEAADYYCNIFSNSSVTVDTPMVVQFNLCNQRMMGLNGGPMFQFNPSISFFVFSNNENEVADLWNKLSQNGKVFMPMNEYPWAKKYGWCSDKFGVSWQVMLNDAFETQAIVPSFMFSNAQAGNAANAMQYYISLFNNSSVVLEDKYKQGEAQPEGTIKYARFALNNKLFSIMDNAMPSDFNFNEAISFVVECKDQKEIDFYWNELTSNGGEESRCGWLKDKFGISWQIVPHNIGALIMNPNNGQRAMQKMMGMQKLVIEELENA